jgi:hypothetical protein
MPCRRPPISGVAASRVGGLQQSYYPLGHPMLNAPAVRTLRALFSQPSPDAQEAAELGDIAMIRWTMFKKDIINQY